jgi:hypothetical protein
MKKYKFFALAFAALTLGACSSDDVVDEQRGPEWNAEGQGYINLAINLPSQPASRANDEYDDGTPEEYDVKDATLILFSDGKVNSAYSMDLNFALDGSSDNITTTARITQQINSMTGTIEALVVLNNNGVFTVGEGGALTVGGAPMADKSLDELNKAISDNIGTNRNWHNNGFLMSNAVLATAPGGANASTGSAKTLVPIADKIYDTEAEASNNPAANIYVERAEAKVTVTNSLSGKTTDGSNMAYEIDGWCLDNTNNTSKLVRTVNGFDTWKGFASNAAIALPANKYRFVGSTPVGTNVAGNETYYRIYWGDDYNYTATGADALTTVGQTVADGSLINDIDGNTPQYCFENTTDLATMRENNCTRVVVKASFNGGQPFYTVDGDRATVWTATDAAAEAASRIVADAAFQTWASTHVQAGQTLESTDLVVTLSDEAGVAEVEAVTLTEDGQAKLNEDADFATANAVDLGNENIDLKYYANGEAYYSVWVSHFGEDGTPWNGGETQTPSVDNIYHDSDQNYLGRWGMLRNNWYEVNLTGIRSLGEPTVSKATGDTIDKLESFISAQINVLSWTKRTQEAEL